MINRDKASPVTIGAVNYFRLSIFFIAWAAKDVFVKRSLEQLTPFQLTLSVSLVVSFSLLPIVLLQARRHRSEYELSLNRASRGLLLGLSISTTLAFYSTVQAIQLLGPFVYAVTDLVTYTAFIAILSRRFLRERISFSIVSSIVFAIIGFGVFQTRFLSEPSSSSGVGLAVAATSSFFWATSLVIAKQLLTNGVAAVQIVFSRFLLLGVLAVLLLPTMSMSLSRSMVFELIGLSVLGYAIPFVFFFKGLAHLPALTVTIFVASSPLFTALFAWLLLPGTNFTFVQGIGLGIIMSALVHAVRPRPVRNSI